MTDALFILQWFIVFLAIGLIYLPMSSFIFSKFADRGYIFSKVLGIVFISYFVFLFSTLKILTFNLAILFSLLLSLAINYYAVKKLGIKNIFKGNVIVSVFEEGLFLACLSFWSFVRGNQPDIHGLEKFMDFGFINSILRSEYLPPKDIWFTPFTINYYYFGHLITAVITRISSIPSNISYNLMLSSLFALAFVCSLSIGMTILRPIPKKKLVFVGSFLSAFFVSLGGNLHTIYTFFKPYENENPVPIWNLDFSFFTFPNSYWYPNATRFIHNTIHEFPIYSWIVADLHGHVLDVPIVLLTIAVIFSLFISSKFKTYYSILIGFLLAVMYMTNAWDGIIYLLLALIIFAVLSTKIINNRIYFSFFDFVKPTAITFISYFIFSFPFSITFKPFVSGIGVLCAPRALTDIGKIGPFLFEADHCQLSPPWQLLILYGFFYFLVASFIVILRRLKEIKKEDIFIISLIALSSFLILLPEFIYIKDIYPTHYRANTMFKLVYQAFIMLSLSSAYIIIRIFSIVKKLKKDAIVFLIWSVVFFILLLMIVIYPYLAVPSYYNNLQKFQGLDGTVYLKTTYPDDYKAINWLNKNIEGQPVILEAQGDSYTDYARVSANTGLPTILGWTVHEWLWRGTYDIPAPRITEVEDLYQSKDINKVKSLIKKYQISLVFIGSLEKEKYKNLNEDNFKNLGKIVFEERSTKIYKINHF
jgi:uncharacterized membrane protein